MAITVSQLIQRAYRENNLIPIGRDPTTAEVTESLSVYQGLVGGWYGSLIGVSLRDWEAQFEPTSTKPSRYPLYPIKPYVPPEVWVNPPPNVRIVANLPSAKTIYFPPKPDDGARMALINVGVDFATYNLILDGNGRKIEGADSITYTANPVGYPSWFYRADLGNWVLVTPPALADEIPFDEQFTDFQVAALAIRRAPAYNKPINAETQAAYNNGLTLLNTRYYQSAPANVMPAAWRMNTYQSYGSPGTGWMW